MLKTIEQHARFDARADDLFDLYLDSERHSEAINSEAAISPDEGLNFSIFRGELTGKNLLIVPKRLIVQSWRGKVWKEDDLDSILILTFRDAPDGAVIDLVHANVPDHAFDKINHGWEQHYWRPWREYLSKKALKAKA